MDLDVFVKNFNYEPDGIVDSYHILEEGEAGDCDDFAITVAYILSGGLIKLIIGLMTFRYMLYWCKAPTGESHVILWARGHGWIDNIFPYWREEPKGHTRRVYLPFFFPVIKLILGKFISN